MRPDHCPDQHDVCLQLHGDEEAADAHGQGFPRDPPDGTAVEDGPEVEPAEHEAPGKRCQQCAWCERRSEQLDERSTVHGHTEHQNEIGKSRDHEHGQLEVHTHVRPERRKRRA